MLRGFWRGKNVDWRVRALVSVALFGLGLVAARLDLVRKLEWKTEDARLELRSLRAAPPHEALCLIGVDEKSLEDFGQ